MNAKHWFVTSGSIWQDAATGEATDDYAESCVYCGVELKDLNQLKEDCPVASCTTRDPEVCVVCDKVLDADTCPALMNANIV
jgi:formylmethanofuran dehydrogenase subunit D